MAIKTSTFEGWTLSGEDAEAFEKQITNCAPNPLAEEAFRRGKPLAEEYLKNGYVILTPQSNNTLKKA